MLDLIKTLIPAYRKAIAAAIGAGAASLSAFAATGNLTDWRTALAAAGTAAVAALVTAIAPANKPAA